MSINNIKKNIGKFLESENHELLALYGEWGIGKTYLWNKIIKEKRSKIPGIYTGYAYVSLFGLNSVDELKNRCFESMIEINGIARSLPIACEKKFNILDMMKKIPKMSSWIQALSKINSKANLLIPALDILIESTIKNAVICFDDIERAGENLKPEQMLGYINFLKEQKDCKIILIGNFNKISEVDKFKELNEKAIDRRLELDISSEECAKLVIPDSNPFAKILQNCISQLNLKNMRIIKTIVSLTDSLEKIFCENEIENYTWECLLKTLCLFCVCQYIVRDDIPTLEFLIKNRKKIPELFGSADENIKRRMLILKGYKFIGFSEVDYFIAKGVISGFFDEDAIARETDKLNDEIKKSKLIEEKHSIWDSFCSGFSNNQKQVKDDLTEGYYVYKENMGPQAVDEIISVLKCIGENVLAETIIDDYIKYVIDKRYAYNEKDYVFFNRLKDEPFKIALEKASEMLKPLPGFLVAIDHISHNRSWSPVHEEVLSRSSEEEYYNLFKQCSISELRKYLDALAVFTSSRNQKEEYRIISEKIKVALDNLRKESPLNACRLNKI